MTPKISDEFKSRLDKSTLDSMLSVVIFVKQMDGLDEKLQDLPPGNTWERRDIIALHNNESFKPMYDYMESNEVAGYITHLTMGNMVAGLKVSQIYELAEQDYVNNKFLI